MSEKLKHLCRGAEKECTASSSRPSGDKADSPLRSSRWTNASKIFTVLFAVLALAGVGFLDRSAAHRGTANTALALLDGLLAHSNSELAAGACKHTKAAASLASPLAALSLTTEVPLPKPGAERLATTTLAKAPVATPHPTSAALRPSAIDDVKPSPLRTAKNQRNDPRHSTVAKKRDRSAASPLGTVSAESQINEPVPQGQEPSSETSPHAPPGLTADGRVILNTATARQLTRLPSIGTKRAAKIVALRSRIGRFRKLTDLLRVRGIGRKSLRKLLPRLVLDRAAHPRVRRVRHGGAANQ